MVHHTPQTLSPPDLTEGNGARPVAVGLLDAPDGCYLGALPLVDLRADCLVLGVTRMPYQAIWGEGG